MTGAAVGERQWWTFESDFDVASFGELASGERYCGLVAATVGQMSFFWRVALSPKGSGRAAGAKVEAADRMGISIQLVDSPIVQLEGVLYNVKVSKADGSLGLNRSFATTFRVDCSRPADCLPNAEQLRSYFHQGEEGSQFVRVRVELGIPTSAFDALRHVPLPPPRLDVNERLARWYHSGAGMVKLVANDGAQFTVYQDLLSDSSEALAALRPRKDRRIHFDGLCGEALDELVSHITFGSTRPSRVRQHVISLVDASLRYELPTLKVVCERAVVEKMLAQRLPADLLYLLAAAETYELRVALNVGLCRLLTVFHQLPDADQDRFNSPDYDSVRKRFMNLSSQSQLAVKR